MLAISHYHCRCHRESRLAKSQVGTQCNSQWPSHSVRTSVGPRLIAYLTVYSRVCHPSCCGPPGDEEAKESPILWPCTSSRPYIGRTAQRQCRADFSKDESGDEHEHHRYEKGGPRWNESVKAIDSTWVASTLPYCGRSTSLQTQE
jgi:hypothetical protein